MAAENAGESGGTAVQGEAPVVAPARLRLRKLVIHRFMDVEPGTTLEFHDGINVVLGKNGSGKTTLLELISAVVRGNFMAFGRRHLDVEYELVTGKLRITGHLQHDPAQRPLSEHTVQYRLGEEVHSVKLGPRTGGLALDLPDLVGAGMVHLAIPFSSDFATAFMVPLFEPPVSTVGSSRAELEATAARLVVMQRRQEIFSSLTVARTAVRLDEGLDFFRFEMMEPPGTSRGMELSRQRDAEGRKHPDVTIAMPLSYALIQRVIAVAATYGDIERIDLREALPYLPGFSTAVELEIVQFSMQRQSIQHDGDRETITFGLPSFYFRVPNGDLLHHTDLSYGERRLLAIYHYLACNPDLAIIDEPVNGLHHSWITACLTEIGDRQAFLASQNPLLLNELPVASAEIAQKMFVLCTRERTPEGKTVRRWKHMTEDEARWFFEALDVGIQHLSDVLRTQGLW